MLYDLVIIGGGINGAGIARDAAGRGLSVLLLEQGDLAQATSSASTKLIHGGLRYLEQYEFKLVAKALAEREVLLKAAPHIIWPLTFVIPHEPHLRSRWMIRAGLFLYDWLGGFRSILPASRGVDLRLDPAGAPLMEGYQHGFSYADCWVDDARLVVLNALDAQERGAQILTRTACTGLTVEGGQWLVQTKDGATGASQTYKARAVVNAAGPWVRSFLEGQDLVRPQTLGMRLSKGSHIIVPRFYDGDHAYLLQQPDGRIVFTIPYEHKFTLIGTTDVAYEGDPQKTEIDAQEIAYLCGAVGRSFKASIAPGDVVHSFSGVRGLLDSGDDNLSEVTRDYKLDLDTSHGAPLLNVFGGKITTFRTLSQKVVDHLAPLLANGHGHWTKGVPLPGGDMAHADFEAFLVGVEARYPWLDTKLRLRLARHYGTRIDRILHGAQSVQDLGQHFGHNIYEAEIRYLMEHEWAQTPDDVLWRRTKLLLHSCEKTQKAIAAYMNITMQEEGRVP